MAGICTESVRDSGGSCEHLTLTVDLDGTPRTVRTGHNDPRWSIALADEELDQLCKLLARWWKGKGADLAAFIGRVLCGEEATNVKMYDFFGPGAAITKTNIGTAYVNIPPGANGERIAVDFTGCTQFRFIMSANLVGTGQWGARCVRDGDNEVLIEQANLGAVGERELDSNWQNLPAAFLGQGLTFLRVQGKSQTATDDPVFRRCVLGLK
jgi:hypothetical protein